MLKAMGINEITYGKKHRGKVTKIDLRGIPTLIRRRKKTTDTENE